MQTKQKALRRSLWASALAILLCIAMLLGTTFAWFTDTVSSANNTIKSGTLDIVAQVASVSSSAAKTYTIEDVNGGVAFGFGEPTDIKDAAPIISEELWEPGKTGAKLVSVTNKGSLAAKVKLQFDVQNSGLQNALWFDFVQVDGDKTTGTFTKRPMSSINTLASSTEFPLGPEGDKKLKDTVQFILVYGMYEDAGNEYQDKEFKATVNIVATQYTYEEDGFGSNQYDEDAPLDFVAVSTAEELNQAISAAKEGETVNVVLTDDVSFDSNFTMAGLTNDVTIQANGYTITSTQGTKQRGIAIEDAQNPGTITINDAEIQLKQSSVAGTNDVRGVSIFNMGGSEVILNNCNIDLTANDYAYGVNITGNNDTGKNAVKLTMRNCTVNGANCINIDGSDHTITIDGCVLNCTYAPSASHYGSCIRLYGTGSTLTVTNTVFNGDNAKAVGEDTEGSNTITLTACEDNTQTSQP